MNIDIQISLCDHNFNSIGYTLRSGIYISYGNYIFLRNSHSVFSSRQTVFHSHQQFTRVPISPYLCQNFIFFLSVFIVFLSYLAILNGMRLYVIMILIYISLIIGNAGHFSPVFVDHLYIFFGDLCQFLIGSFGLFLLLLICTVLFIFWILTPYWLQIDSN